MGLPPARGFFGRTTTRVDMNHSWSILFRQTWVPRSKQFLAYNSTKLLGWGYEFAWEERRVTFKQGTEYPLETFPSQQRWRIALPLFVWCEIPSNLLTFHWHPGGWVIKWNKEMPLFNITVLHFGTVRGPLSRWTQAGLCSCGFQGGCVLNKSHVSGKEHLKVWISMNKKDQTNMNLHGWRLATHTPRTPQLKYTYNSARVQIRRVQSNSYDSNIKSKSSFTNLHSWHFFHFRYLHRWFLPTKCTSGRLSPTVFFTQN